MKIIVCGCGKIGATLLAALESEGHDVVAIDNSAAVVGEITNIYDVMGVCGNGADCETLEEAGIRDTELFVAVTDSDELNMLACFLARKMGASHTVARIRNPEYNDESLTFMKRELGLSMAINPEAYAAKELYDILKLPSATKVEQFAGHALEMVELKLRENSPLDSLDLKTLREKYSARVLVCVVRRGEDVFIPKGDFILKSGDRVGLTAAPAEIVKFLRQIDMLQKQSKSVMLLGGGKTAYYLAKRLCASGINVKIIEKNKHVAQSLSELLPQCMVIHGDGASQELLLEEGIGSTDAFVSLTGVDEENILISIYAQTHNVPKVIAKVNKNELASMAEKLGLDCIISPKNTISDLMVQYARAIENSRGSNVETLYKLMDDKAEALEFYVRQNDLITEIPLRKLKLKPNIIIGGIIRGRRLIIPAGEDTILPGDRVVIFAADSRLQDLADIIEQ